MKALTDIYADSGYYDDIQTAVDSAGNGDTVHIPTGTHDFDNGVSWNTVTVPAGVSLTGTLNERGEDGIPDSWATVLQQTYDAVSNDANGVKKWFQFNGTGQSNEISRFHDIKLSGYADSHSSDYYLVAINAVGLVDFRFDHNYFSNTRAGITCVASANDGAICGVLDHNNLINTNTTVGGSGWNDALRNVDYGVMPYRTAGSTAWDNDWSNVLGQYTNYSIYIENNYFSQWKHCVSSNNGMHYVFRYNTIEGDNGRSLDAHEAYTNVPSRATEIYGNQILDPRYLEEAQPNVVNIRGGAVVCYNNTIRDYYFMVYWRDGNYADGQPGTEYSPAAFWNNTYLSGGAHYDEFQIWESNQAERGTEYYYYNEELPDYSAYTYPHPLTNESSPWGESSTYYYFHNKKPKEVVLTPKTVSNVDWSWKALERASLDYRINKVLKESKKKI